jgi:rubrerythrin
MNLRVDIYSCEECGRAIVIEEDEAMEVCPYAGCGSSGVEYSHSGKVEND